MVPPRRQQPGEDAKKASRKPAKPTKSSKSGTQKKQEAMSSAGPSASSSPTPTFAATPKEQQSILDTFVRAFPLLLGHGVDQEVLLRTLQEVKSHLYNRDFLAAFGQESYLEAYAARWSPSRAWGYTTILGEVLIDARKKGYISSSEEEDNVSAVCLGGGAGAELVALGMAVAIINNRAETLHLQADDGEESNRAAKSKCLKLDVKLVDIAAWQDVVSLLHGALKTPPVLSAYASAAAKAANRPIVQAEELSFTFTQVDVLKLSFDALTQLVEGVKLITIMFTLNELYSTSLSDTQAFLLSLTSLTAPGTLLLVVDSPSSYSQVKLAGKDKTYPMHYLLDVTLLSMAKGAQDDDGAASFVGSSAAPLDLGEGDKSPIIEDNTEPMWEKIMEDQSRWFRVPQSLRYPLELENMRCQIHLFLRK